jgi:hypothetical protein
VKLGCRPRLSFALPCTLQAGACERAEAAHARATAALARAEGAGGGGGGGATRDGAGMVAALRDEVARLRQQVGGVGGAAAGCLDPAPAGWAWNPAQTDGSAACQLPRFHV